MHAGVFILSVYRCTCAYVNLHREYMFVHVCVRVPGTQKTGCKLRHLPPEVFRCRPSLHIEFNPETKQRSQGRRKWKQGQKPKLPEEGS